MAFLVSFGAIKIQSRNPSSVEVKAHCLLRGILEEPGRQPTFLELEFLS
jgi:hypothetical protein